MASPKLPPINTDKEAKKYEAYQESQEVSFPKCDHKRAKVVGNQVRCPCGVAYGGGRLNELLDLLKK